VASPCILRALCGALAIGSAPAATPGLAPGDATPGAAERRPAVSIRWGPYKDASVQLAADPPRLQVRVGARVVALTAAPGTSGDGAGPLPSDATLTLAFATGECGRETMAGVPGAALARANAPLFEAAGVDFIVSTGGEMGRFTCASAQGMEDFLAHYRSPRLVGIDFDIEGERTEFELAALTHQIAAAQSRHPGLRWSFTLATFAGNDARRSGLNSLSASVLAAARNAGVRDFIVNLMVMDYGAPSPAVCVSIDHTCDMARSAIQAADNLHAQHAVPYDRIELTAMLGRNDTAGSVTRLHDMRAIAHYVRERGLAGLHYWSLDRDNPCTDNAPKSDCSGMSYAPLAFTRAIEASLRATRPASPDQSQSTAPASEQNKQTSASLRNNREPADNGTQEHRQKY
jgi:chitinase